MFSKMAAINLLITILFIAFTSVSCKENETELIEESIQKIGNELASIDGKQILQFLETSDFDFLRPILLALAPFFYFMIPLAMNIISGLTPYAFIIFYPLFVRYLPEVLQLIPWRQVKTKLENTSTDGKLLSPAGRGILKKLAVISIVGLILLENLLTSSFYSSHHSGGTHSHHHNYHGKHYYAY